MSKELTPATEPTTDALHVIELEDRLEMVQAEAAAADVVISCCFD